MASTQNNIGVIEEENIQSLAKTNCGRELTEEELAKAREIALYDEEVRGELDSLIIKIAEKAIDNSSE